MPEEIQKNYLWNPRRNSERNPWTKKNSSINFARNYRKNPGWKKCSKKSCACSSERNAGRNPRNPGTTTEIWAGTLRKKTARTARKYPMKSSGEKIIFFCKKSQEELRLKSNRGLWEQHRENLQPESRENFGNIFWKIPCNNLNLPGKNYEKHLFQLVTLSKASCRFYLYHSQCYYEQVIYMATVTGNKLFDTSLFLLVSNKLYRVTVAM